MALPGDELGSELPPPPESDFDAEEPADGFAATDAAVGGTETLGRELR
jgi:hypothetical protein